jgi:hypothetical protein
MGVGVFCFPEIRMTDHLWLEGSSGLWKSCSDSVLRYKTCSRNCPRGQVVDRMKKDLK